MNRWFPAAVRDEGPPWKHGYGGAPEPGPKRGIVYHSAEGYWDAMRQVLWSSRSASWTFSNPKRGRLRQHFPRGYHAWANGSGEANILFDSCESEGTEGEPLTESQVANLVDLAEWYKEEEGWDRLERLYTLWEHNEMTRYGADPTACPSGRIDPVWEILVSSQEGDMADPEVRQAMTVAGWIAQWLGYALARQKLPEGELKQKLRYLLAG